MTRLCNSGAWSVRRALRARGNLLDHYPLPLPSKLQGKGWIVWQNFLIFFHIRNQRERKLTPPSNAANMERTTMRKLLVRSTGLSRIFWGDGGLPPRTRGHWMMWLDPVPYYSWLSDVSETGLTYRWQRFALTPVNFQILKGRNPRQECRRGFIT